jgi:two-component system, LuxR family, response regulator FixJ
MNPSRTVYVVDDEPGARESLRWLLESVKFRVITCESGDEFFEAFEDQPDCCVIVDLRMPGIGGLALLERLASRAISPPVIIVTGYGNVSSTARAMRAGAVHVLEKPYNDQELLETIQEAFDRDARNRTRYSQRIAVESRLALLTPREREVLDLVVTGKSNKAMASQLRVSEKNIEYHRANLYQKMQVENLAELVRMVLTESVA